MTVRNFDIKCMELAEHFLYRTVEVETRKEYDELVTDLSLAIQGAVEEWMDEHATPAARDPYSPQYEGPSR